MLFRMLPYVRHSLKRSRRRSLLIILGVAVAVYVICSLQTTIVNMSKPKSDRESERILNVREAARSNVGASRLPQGFERIIADIPGVQAATGVLSEMALTGGKHRMHIFVRGVDPETYLRVHAIPIDQAQWAEFAGAANATIVGSRLLKNMDWHVGDTVEISKFNMKVRIVGVIPPEVIELEKQMLVQRRFLQIARKLEGRVSYVLVSPAQGADPLQLASKIDTAMRMTPVPTQTVSAAAFAEATIRDYMGFINYLKMIRWIVIGITVLGAANAIGIGVRERTRELGTLKAIGLPPRLICSLVIAEALLLSLIGGIIGVAAAALLLQSGMTIHPAIALAGVGISAMIGVFGGFPPALSASRLHIVEALRTID